jgi:hypothetical protein
MMINGKYSIDTSMQRHVIYTVAYNTEIALDVILKALEESTETYCIDYDNPIELSLTREIKP